MFLKKVNKFYVPQFLLASLGRDAPSNDLNLYTSLIHYREVDRELANIATVVHSPLAVGHKILTF